MPLYFLKLLNKVMFPSRQPGSKILANFYLAVGEQMILSLFSAAFYMFEVSLPASPHSIRGCLKGRSEIEPLTPT